MTYPPQQPGQYPGDQPAWQPQPPQYQPPRKRRKKWPWITGGIVALLIVFAAIGSSNKPATTGGTTPATTGQAAPLTSGDPGSPPSQVAAATTTVDTPTVPPQEQEAIGAAQDYLKFSAFSRQGLIDQLDSSAGDGYPVDVATAAVDSLNVDWNAQAAKSAQSYLSMSHFSCSGLISQLDSSAGEKFTQAQATYGAHQTSACG